RDHVPRVADEVDDAAASEAAEVLLEALPAARRLVRAVDPLGTEGARELGHEHGLAAGEVEPPARGRVEGVDVAARRVAVEDRAVLRPLHLAATAATRRRAAAGLQRIGDPD